MSNKKNNRENNMNPLNENRLKIMFILIYLMTTIWTLDQPSKSPKNQSKLPLVINTWTFVEATEAGWQALIRPNGNVFDAVEIGCSTCEKLQCDGSVGWGSHPDENGIVTLDAMIMDGESQNVGAVASMYSIKNAASVARKVLEHCEHSLLVGEAATKFALKFGFKLESLESDHSKKEHNDWIKNNCQPNFWTNVLPDPKSSCGPYRTVEDDQSEGQQIDKKNKEKSLNKTLIPQDIRHHDTIGLIAIDSKGHIVAGTSTNGASHKIPGRVGDSAIVGSGAYADNENGAAVSTGDGDVIMRFSPARVAVLYLEQEKSVSEAAYLALRKVQLKFPKNQAAIVVASKSGEYAAACYGMDQFVYSLRNQLSDEVQVEYVDCFDG